MLTRPFQTPYLPDYVSPASVQHRVSDFTSGSLVEAFHGTDLLISTVPGYDVQDVILQSAVVARVPRFIPYEFGQDALNAAIQRRLPGVSERAKTIERLQKQSNQHPNKLQWVGIAMGCIVDTALSNGNLGFDLTWQSGTLLGTGHEIFAATSLERVGMVVECVIRDWEIFKNQYIYAAGTLTSANDIMTTLERYSDSKWSADYSEVEECVREGQSRVTKGYLDSGMFLLERSVLFDTSLRATEPFETQSVNARLCLEQENTESIVKEAYRKLRRREMPGCGCGD